MGRRSRARQQRTAGPAPEPAPGVCYFHGGVPGQPAGQILLPARRLGVKYHYTAGTATTAYDPAWVYFTTDEGVAAAYASRCRDLAGRAVPGDLYEVKPIDPPQPDPDYWGWPGTFLRSRRARIIRIVQTAITLTVTEQALLERRYLCWNNPEEPVWDDAGLIIPSAQMTKNGVTREWTTMLRPWLHPADVDAKGRLSIARRAADPWRAILDTVAALDRDCQIEPATRWFGRRGRYRCASCGQHPAGLQAAVLHQLGETPVMLLTRIQGWDQPPLAQLAQAAAAREPSRWQWLPGQPSPPNRPTLRQ